MRRQIQKDYFLTCSLLLSNSIFRSTGMRMGKEQESNLLYLIRIALICPWTIIGEGLGTGKFVIGRWCGYNVSLTCYLACKSSYWTRDCTFISLEQSESSVDAGGRRALINFAEKNDAREFGMRIAWYGGVEEEDACA